VITPRMPERRRRGAKLTSRPVQQQETISSNPAGAIGIFMRAIGWPQAGVFSTWAFRCLLAAEGRPTLIVRLRAAGRA